MTRSEFGLLRRPPLTPSTSTPDPPAVRLPGRRVNAACASCLVRRDRVEPRDSTARTLRVIMMHKHTVHEVPMCAQLIIQTNSTGLTAPPPPPHMRHPPGTPWSCVMRISWFPCAHSGGPRAAPQPRWYRAESVGYSHKHQPMALTTLHRLQIPPSLSHFARTKMMTSTILSVPFFRADVCPM